MIEIIVNSRPRQVHQHVLTYVDVLQFAFPGAVNTETTIFTITFEHAAGQRHEGTLVQGDSVRVHKGTCFHVAKSDKS